MCRETSTSGDGLHLKWLTLRLAPQGKRYQKSVAVEAVQQMVEYHRASVQLIIVLLANVYRQ